MKNLFLITIIIMFLFKTGNVLSQKSIFNVNNIEIDSSIHKSQQDLLDFAFKKGFKELVDRILLDEDIEKILETKTSKIKSLISYYQVVDPRTSLKSDKTIVNINFDREKINEFFYIKNITYSDLINTDLILFPVLLEKNNFYLYSQNYFYKNWNIQTIENDNQNLIDYVLPIENLENIKIVKDNIDNLEELNIKVLLSDYIDTNSIFLVVDLNDDVNIFLKGSMFGKNISRNFKIEKGTLEGEILYKKIIFETKKVIVELIKSQNLIDIRTPSFLNINLDINKENDLLYLQNILKKIDLIESFRVQELNKDYAKLKIKYFGKIDKIAEKFKINGIKIINLNNQWKLKII